METIAETTTRIAQFISETFPNVDLAPGSVVNELIVKLSASVQNELYTDILDFSQGGSFKTALESTTDTYSDVITNLASNYLVTRGEGTKATGVLKVTLSSNSGKYISLGTRFKHSASGLLYETVLKYEAATNPTSDELRIYTQATGIYYLLLPVVAVESGAEYQVVNGSSFEPAETSSVLDSVNIAAFGNFTSGKAIETDKQLIARISTGVTNKGLTSEASILARVATLYSSVKDISIVGAGHPMMTRSKQNAFGIDTFGMADVYVRSTNSVVTTTITKQGIRTAVNEWTIVMDHSDVAGFYNVQQIKPDVSNVGGSLTITSLVYDAAEIPNEPNNRIPSAAYGRFTQYQRATIKVYYPETPVLDVGAVANFSVTVNHQPYIKEIQSMLNDKANRIAAADYLVKAAIPCYVSVKASIEKKSPASSLDVEGIKQAVVNYINNIQFGDTLSVSQIIDICHNFENVRRVGTPLTITAELVAADGTTANITTKDVLIVDGILAGVSADMVAFFASYGDETGVAITTI